MESHSSRKAARQAGPFRARIWTAILVGVALGVAAFFVVRALTGSDEKGGELRGPNGAFTLAYPEDWIPVSNQELEKLPGPPLAAVRRKDRKAIVTLDRERRVTRNLGRLSAQFDRKLKRGVPDFQKVSSRIVSINAGRAFLYSYVRKGRGTVHTAVVVPVGPGGYTLNAVVQGGADDAARQVGAIIRTFDA
jgi:hypothetical protein